MASPTKPTLTPADIAGLVSLAFGPGAAVVEAVPLDSGFAAVSRVRLRAGPPVVLKVGPGPDVPLLRYERGMIAAETRYLRRLARSAPTVPVPRVLGHGDDWLFAELLPGTSLAQIRAPQSTLDSDGIRADLGAVVARINAVTGDLWGYDGGRTSGRTWPEAFAGMVDDLLADAADFAVALPVPAAGIRALVARHGDALGAVRRPALVHFDTWDGNVLVDGQPPRLTGLVDGERHLYGDPLLDFVSPALYSRIEDQPAHPFLRGYRSVSTPPARDDSARDDSARDDSARDDLVWDDSALRRLRLYRLFFSLLMLVEMPIRGMVTAADGPRRDRLTGLLLGDVADLG